jgi:propionyl-CoA carboxylase alpha chain
VSTQLPLTSVLVANRGEIARRVFRTARAMGMRCVAVYVDADGDAPFVTEADEAIRLSGGYLDGAEIIAAALVCGAQAIHPGYGFLSENAHFAQAVIDAGLVWVGPSPEVIGSMGDKIAAKEAATAAGVPTLPSTTDADRAGSIGYPLLVKASAGGGGKGMRIVDDPADLADAIAGAQREAAASFGDDRVFLERYVPRSRHIEIQILGDRHGNLIHLGERECSIQRRHQKLIEEAPSPFVSQIMRAEMGQAALKLGAAMGYESAGTVEFLVDDTTGEFFFLEVNTRLQVEHPVTEAVTGIDLVRQQLRIAAGEPLTHTQGDITWTGHAIEVRLNAEDAEAGFLPATGTLSAFVPATEPAVRWDSGVETGSVVGVAFDPMLAKVIAHGPTRAEAAGRLALALERLHLAGVVTNRDFLAATLRTPEFVAGDTTTDFIARVGPDVRGPVAETNRACLIAALWLQHANRSSDPVWGFAPSNWRNARLPSERVVLRPDSTSDDIDVAYRVRRDGRVVFDSGPTAVVHHVGGSRVGHGVIDVAIDGRRTVAQVTQAGARIYVQVVGGTIGLAVVPRFEVPGQQLPTGGLVAPMPGSVLQVLVAIGDQVAPGQVMVILEAMKMEHHISAPCSGIVTDVPIVVGQQVDNGALLLTIESLDDTPNGPVS